MSIQRHKDTFHVEARITSYDGAHIASIAVYRSESLQSAIQWKISMAEAFALHEEVGIPAIDAFLKAMRAGNRVTFHVGG